MARIVVATAIAFAILVVPAQAAGSSERAASLDGAALRLVANIADCEPIGVSFNAPPVSGTIQSAAEVDCYALPGAVTGDRLRIDHLGPGSRAVVSASGTTVCTSSDCTLFGTGPFELRVSGAGWSPPFSYTTAVRRVSNPEGCAPLGEPAAWSFTAPPIDGSIGGPLAARCFTFTRPASEGDGVYWFRAARTSGTVNPQWRVVGPTGGTQCASSGTSFQPCSLQAHGQYVLIVDDANGSNTGSFVLTTARVNARTGCSTLPSVAFGAAPVAGTLGGIGQIDCHTIPDVAAGDRVRIATQGSPERLVVNGAGDLVCTSSSSSCSLFGPGPWAVLVHEHSRSEASAYAMAVRRITDPAGCAPVGEPEVWSFAAAGLVGTVDGSLDAECFTFSRDAGEGDGVYWFRALRSSGSLSPDWTVFDAGGVLRCSGTSGLEPCSLIGGGRHTLVIDDGGGTQTGSFLATAKRLTARTGCTTVPSIAFGTQPSSGGISSAGEVDCHTLPGFVAGDRIELAFSGSAQRQIVDAAGSVICQSDECTLSGSAPFAALVYESTTATSAYSLAVHRLNDPQGCAPLGEPEAWSFTAPRIDGTIDGPLDARCYTFTRAAAEEDATYWFRVVRRSGSLNQRWRVLGPNGTTRCSGSSAAFDSCALLTTGRHALVVSDASGTQTGSFLAVARRLTERTGCSTLPSIAFGAPPVAGTLAAAGEADCLTLPDVSDDDRVSIDVRGGASAVVVDGDGSAICSVAASDCTLAGRAPWSLLVYDTSTSSGVGYSVAVRRLTDPQGCTQLPEDAWSFTAPRLTGSLDDDLDARCYTFTRAAAEGDGAYWFRALRTSGTLNPRWRVTAADGSERCQGGSVSFTRCELVTTGRHALVVTGSSGSGAFVASAKRLHVPTGCAQLPPIAFGFGPVIGNLAPGEIDCYTLPAATGDELNFTSTGTATNLAIVDQDGNPRCLNWSSTCTITDDQPLVMLVYSTSSTAGTYRFEGSCANVPCGQSNTGVTDAVPNRVGPGRHTSVVLRGRDLQLLSGATLRLGDRVVEGEIQDAAPDGRATEVRFDLDGAPTGSWTLTASFLDGSTRIVPAAVQVETLRPPKISVGLSGREAFRVGQPTTVAVEVSNSGNVDGIGVPVVLGGIPEGSTIAPAFTMHTADGSASDYEIVDVPFEQATHTSTENGTIEIPLLMARVPAGRSVRMEYAITVPQSADFSLRVQAGNCLGTTSPGSVTAPRAVARASAADWNCIGSASDLLLDFVPGAACANRIGQVTTSADLATDALEQAKGGDSVFSPTNLLSWGLTLGECASELFPGTAIAKRIGKIFKRSGDILDAGEAGWDCFVSPARSELRQRAVTSVDPNDIRGPVGTGDQRFIAGDTPLAYQVLFENLPAATAPAQRVAITNPLDTAVFDPASVLFEEIRFGSTVYRLPYADRELDHVIDLRPALSLLVHVTAGVTPAGVVHWELQAIDPETLQPPEDPLVGFLPPNTTSQQGEGLVGYRVRLRDLPSGATVPNRASIVFDGNAAIETPTWTNRIDRQPPAPAVTVAGTADPDQATVTWSGSDDAAGIGYWEVRVSKDGGPATLWHAGDEPGSRTFVADGPGTYAFRVSAQDRAGNLGVSAQAGVQLGGANTTPGSTTPPGSTVQPGGSDPASGSTVVAPLIAGSASLTAKPSRSGTVALGTRVRCLGSGPDCSVVVALRAGKVKLGTSRLTVPAGTTAKVKGKLSRAGLRRLGKRGSLRASARITVRRAEQLTVKTIVVRLKR